jgi:hypothetical protein
MFRDGYRPVLTRLGARLGLLALALQLVLSFAHIHPLPLRETALSAPARSTAPDLPLADGACAICASIAAFSTLDLPLQAEFVAPATTAEIVALAVPVGQPPRAPPARHFSSRAPPAA